jgi:IclR family transcriptional regulator, KDG regulon repressor
VKIDKGRGTGFYNRSLERALRIINVLGVKQEALSLAQLSNELELPRATILRLCSTLLNFSFLRQDPLTKQYSLGFKILELASIISDTFSLRKITASYLKILQARLGKTIFLGVLDKDELLYIDKIDDPRNPISFTSKVGTRRPPHWGMLGFVLMAYLPENEVNRILNENPLAAFTKKSITKIGEFKKLLGQVRSQGYIVEGEMVLDGITGVAAPVFDRTGKVIAGIGIGFITSSVNTRELNTIVKEVTKVTRMISRELGYNEEGR